MFDPEKRITVTEALEHPYLADLHLEEDEPIREEVNHLDFEFEDFNLTTQQLKGNNELMQTYFMRRFCCTIARSSTRNTKGRKLTRKVSSHIFYKIPTLNTSTPMLIPMSDQRQTILVQACS
jgi:serine/threonine protein kinase